jgi:hypothetical protein
LHAVPSWWARARGAPPDPCRRPLRLLGITAGVGHRAPLTGRMTRWASTTVALAAEGPSTDHRLGHPLRRANSVSIAWTSMTCPRRTGEEASGCSVAGSFGGSCARPAARAGITADLHRVTGGRSGSGESDPPTPQARPSGRVPNVVQRRVR